MNLSIESYFILTLVLITLSIRECQGQDRNCALSARPHPEGICGSNLTLAYSNLCSRLREAYPNRFPSKRSVDSKNFVDKNYNKPKSILAEIDIGNDNWETFLNKREHPYAFVNSRASLAADELESSFVDSQPVFADTKGMMPSLFRLMRKRDDHLIRTVRQISLFCDCCINSCTPSHLATYC